MHGDGIELGDIITIVYIDIGCASVNSAGYAAITAYEKLMIGAGLKYNDMFICMYLW
jgi:hypothetical protein